MPNTTFLIFIYKLDACIELILILCMSLIEYVHNYYNLLNYYN